MTRWDRLLMRLGLHHHKCTGETTYAFGVIIAHCWCGHDFTLEWT